MFKLTRKAEYALIAMAYLAGHPDEVVSARQIAEAYSMPTALVMNILKALNRQNIVTSSRGINGGYKLAAKLDDLSVCGLIEAVEGPLKLTNCSDGKRRPTGKCQINPVCPIQAPVRALHLRMIGFLKEVKLSDILLPGRRIEVPLELLGTD